MLDRTLEDGFRRNGRTMIELAKEIMNDKKLMTAIVVMVCMFATIILDAIFDKKE